MAGTCATVQPLLPGFVDEELADQQVELVHAHLRDCMGCRREAADYLQAHRALRRAATDLAERSEVPLAELHDEMHRQIMDSVAADDVVAASPRSRWSRGGRLAGVAAAVLLGALGFWLGTDERPESIWVRPGVASQQPSPRAVQVVPYAGSPADIRPVGRQESGLQKSGLQKYGSARPGSAETGIGPGMMGRGTLRAPVEVMPAVEYQRRQESEIEGEEPHWSPLPPSFLYHNWSKPDRR